MTHANREPSSKIALVTGASRGIGAAICEKLSANGYTVAMLARDPRPLQELAKRINKNGGHVFPVPCDVSKRESVEEALLIVEQNIGTPAIVINNAGMGGPFHRTDQVSPDEWRTIFATNIDSIFYICRILLPKMKSNNYGRIVNISSIYGLAGAELSSTYTATKHAVIGYTKAIAVEWGAYGITSNAICPGYIKTSMLDNHETIDTAKKTKAPLGSAFDVAALVCHIVGSDGSFFNGSSFVMDGGVLATLSS